MIRSCTKGDINYCMDDRSKKNTGLDPELLNESDFIVCAQDYGIMLVHVINNGSSAEVHVICPKICAKQSRSMCVEIIEYLRFLGFCYVTTRVLNKYKKAHNLAIKLGFVCVLSMPQESFYWMAICR